MNDFVFTIAYHNGRWECRSVSPTHIMIHMSFGDTPLEAMANVYLEIKREYVELAKC